MALVGRLGPSALDALPAGVQRPRFDRAALAPGIVHLGIGAFMRAHLAVATDDALDAGDEPVWGITGVSLRSAATRDALTPQHGLYTLALRDATEARHRVVGCITGVLVAPEAPAAVLDRIAAPATRIVSLTITEKGYHQDPASGALQVHHPDLRHDLDHADSPRTAIGFIVHGLARRQASGLGPITLLSLDNLPSNGRRLKALVLDFAERIDAGLARWIDGSCTFPNSMVDRIVPRTTEGDRAAVAAALGVDDAWPVVAEPFFDWAVEDLFAAGRPDWTRGGARFVAHAEPWERLKLRMVNGAHSTIAYLALGAGWATVDEAMRQPALRRAVDTMLRDEVQPTLGELPGLAPDDYRERLLARFANPALAHRCAQIAMDGSQKLPQRLLGTIRERLAAGRPIARLALGVAAWLHHLRELDDRGRSCPIDDPLAEALRALSVAAEAHDDARRRADRFTRFEPVFGDLAGVPALVDALTPWLQSLRERGVRATLDGTMPGR